MRDRLRKRLAAAAKAKEGIEADLAELAETSPGAEMVRKAVTAVEADAEHQLPQVAKAASNLTARVTALTAALGDDEVRLLRKAESFVKDNGFRKLAAAQEAVDALRDEQAVLGDELPGLKEKTTDAAISLIQARLQFENNGGDDRIGTVAATIEKGVAAVTRIDAAMPRLLARLALLADIRAAAEFAAAGGHDAVRMVATTLRAMANRQSQAIEALVEAKRAADKLNVQVKDALKARELAAVCLGKSVDFLHSAQAYLDEDGLTFDDNYQMKLESLKRVRDLAKRRAGFDFTLAAQARDNELKGFSVSSTRARIRELDDMIETGEERWQQVLDEIEVAKAGLEEYRRSETEIDYQVRALIGYWRQAKRVSEDAELTDEMLARNAGAASLARAERYEFAIRECSEDELAERIGELVAEDIQAFGLQTSMRTIETVRRDHGDKRRKFQQRLDGVIGASPRSLRLTDDNRVWLQRARNAEDVDGVKELCECFLATVEESRNRFKACQKDVTDQKAKVDAVLVQFTLKVHQNLDLLRRCLQPTGEGRAGFEIFVQAVEKAEANAVIKSVIELIDRHDRLKQPNADAPQNSEEDLQLKPAIRRVLYRGIFKGIKDSPHPRMKIVHPQITGGRAIFMDEKISTGQANAVALMLITKMAHFGMKRDERYEMMSAGRKRGTLHRTQMVMIDGLFSNLSSPELIRPSLDAVSELKGKLQLIGWIHNPFYQNDPTIFPEHLGIRRIGNGFVIADTIDRENDHADFTAPSPGDAAVIEMHADRLPQPSADGPSGGEATP